tara:strand:- start:33996 stop:35189 length:1194 start_codon:yes stop_codon:yes gene_type:complete
MFELNTEKIREDFPILKKNIIYFDNACMTLKPRQVIEKITEYYNEYPGCHGRSTHQFARKVTEEFENTRVITRKFFNAKKNEEIIFTKNTTEGINLIANSLNLQPEDIILTTDKEHNSNLVPWLRLRDTKRIQHQAIKTGKDFLNNLKQAMNNKVKLVSMVYTSNMDGTSIPAKEVIKIAHDHGALVMLDAAQTASHREIDVKKLDVDFLVCSGHKMLGPTGTGILYGKYHLLEQLNPFIVGGDTVLNTTLEKADYQKPPHKFEAGLQNYAGIIGLGTALQYLKKHLPKLKDHELKLNTYITEKIKDIPGITILGGSPKDRGGIISFYIPKIDSNNLGIMLDKAYNIMTRSGAHCVHSWFNSNNLKGSLRASLHIYNTLEECEIFIKALLEIQKRVT